MEKSLFHIYIYNNRNGKAFFITSERRPKQFSSMVRMIPNAFPTPCINTNFTGKQETTQSTVTKDNFSLSPGLFPLYPPKHTQQRSMSGVWQRQ